MEETFRLGRIAGIPIGVNWSMFLVFWLITWGLAGGVFPEAYPGYAPGTYWVAATVTAIVFYGALLAHELGHSLVARRRGVQVEGITLWLFGGVAKLNGEAASPDAELRIAIAGPAVSVALGVVFAGLAIAFNATGVDDLVVGVLEWLARINLILAVFNLVPAAPLDGGRVLRAVLWRRHGDRVRASVTAARAGRVFGYVLVGLGLFEFALGAGLGGVWFVFLGWFLLSAARAEESHALMRGALGGVRVRDVMSREPMRAPGWFTVGTFIDEYALRHRYAAYPVEDREGHLIGVVTLQRLREVPPDARDAVLVSTIACPLADVPQTEPDTSVIELVEQVAGNADGRALVFDGQTLVGIVSPSDVSRAVEQATLRREHQTDRVRPNESRPNE